MLSGIIPACFHNVSLGADEQAVQTCNFQPQFTV